MIIIRQKYSFDTNFFSKIDTKEKAYWMGFIVADGYVFDNLHKNNKSTAVGLRIRLSEVDKNHLEKLNESLNYNKPINIVKNYGVYQNQKNLAEFYLGSRKVVDDLNHLGITCGNKSGNEIPPKNYISKNLEKYFILGLYDGDGHISVSKNNRLEIGFLSSYNMIYFIKEHLIANKIDATVNKIEERRYKNSTLYRLRFYGKKALQVLNYLYKDSDLFLDRKYQLYQEIISV